MNLNLALVEIILWTISALSGLIAWEFYRSKDGRLRVLIISLFICKIYLYGGAAIWYLYSVPVPDSLIKILILNAPMFFIMLKLYGYVRAKE